MNKKLTDKQYEINAAVRAYFKQHDISYEEIARRMNSATSRAVEVFLASSPFSKKTARKWAAEFGFNEDFLLTGEGDLVFTYKTLEQLKEENKTYRSVLDVQNKILGEDVAEEERLEPGERIVREVQKYFKVHGMTNKYVALKMGYKTADSAASSIHKLPRTKTRGLRKWCAVFGFNLEFLQTGKGRLVIPETPEEELRLENEELSIRIRANRERLKQMKTR